MQEGRNWSKSDDYAQAKVCVPDRVAYSRISLTPNSLLSMLLTFGGEFRVLGDVAASWLVLCV